jgi:hypothetical protein
MSQPHTYGHLQYGDLMLPIIDCKAWRVLGGSPTCTAGHDLESCATCEHRVSRQGNMIDPPIMGPKPPVAPEPQPERIRGLGDVVAAVTKTVGIRPCGGCQKRREALNRAVPFGSAPAPQQGL